MKRYKIVGEETAKAMLKEAFPDCVLGEYVCSGAQGSVYRCTSPSGEEVVKFIDLEKAVLAAAGRPNPELAAAMRAGAMNEINVLKQLVGRSEHTVQLIAEAHDRDLNFIVLRQQMLTPLEEYLRAARRDTSMAKIVLQLGCDLCSALRDLAALNYAHRDVKPENICVLVTEDRVTFCLCDFGSCSLLNKIPAFGSKTVPYAPPEADSVVKLTDHYDVYSVGVLMETLLRREPCPAELSRVIEACKEPLPEDRPSLQQVQKVLAQLLRTATKECRAESQARSKNELRSLKDALRLWCVKGAAAQLTLLRFADSGMLSEGQRSFLHAVMSARPSGRLYALRLGAAEHYLPAMHYYGISLIRQSKRCKDGWQSQKLQDAGRQWLEQAAAQKFYPSKMALEALNGKHYPADYAKLQTIALQAAL